MDAARARAHPGVVDVVTFADLGPAARPLAMVPPHAELRGRNFSLLAGDRARFVGEAVAAVVADSRYAAEDARELIEVEYEPLASAQTLAAGRARRPRRHPRQRGRPGDARPAGTSRPRCARAPRVASLALRIGRGGGQPMETRGLVADWNAALGQLTVWASSQVPHQIRQFVADLLDLAPHQVRVIAPDVGGGFGAKLIVYPEDVLIPFLARRAGAARALARGPPRAHARRDAGARAGARGHGGLRRRRAASWRCATASSTTPARTRRAGWWCRCSPPPC